MIDTNESILWKCLPLITAALSAGVAYFIFSLGQIKAKNKEADRLRYVKEYFYVCLLRFKCGLQSQVSDFEEQLELLKKDCENNFACFRNSQFDNDASPNNLLKIERNDSFSFFIQLKKDQKKKRIKLYSDLYSSLDSVTFAISKMHDVNKEMTREYKDADMNVSKCRDELLHKYTAALQKEQSPKEGIILDDFYILVEIALRKYTKSESEGIDAILNFLIPDVLKIATNNSFLKHPDAIEVLRICLEAETNQITIMSNKKTKLILLGNWIDIYRETISVIEQILQIDFKEFDYKEEIFSSK